MLFQGLRFTATPDACSIAVPASVEFTFEGVDGRRFNNMVCVVVSVPVHGSIGGSLGGSDSDSVSVMVIVSVVIMSVALSVRMSAIFGWE